MTMLAMAHVFVPGFWSVIAYSMAMLLCPMLSGYVPLSLLTVFFVPPSIRMDHILHVRARLMRPGRRRRLWYVIRAM